MALQPLILQNGTVADAKEVMSLFTEIYTNITDENIAAGAGITFSKLDDATVAGVTAVQRLTNKSLTNPTIDDGAAGAGFVNAAHDHSDAAGGGAIALVPHGHTGAADGGSDLGPCTDLTVDNVRINGDDIYYGGADADDLALRINFFGYNGGITRRRDLIVGDGKGFIQLSYDADSNSWYTQNSNLYVMGRTHPTGAIGVDGRILSADQMITGRAVAKVWVSCNKAGSVLSSYNVTSVGAPVAGLYTISYNTDFAFANYVAVAESYYNTSGASINSVVFSTVFKAVSSLSGYVVDTDIDDRDNNDANGVKWGVVCFGNLP